MGVSVRGPHRDEVELRLGEHLARTVGSGGQRESLAIALALAAGNVLAAEGRPALMLLDDPFTELDAQRVERLVRLLPERGQTILTAARREGLPVASDANVLTVTHGHVKGLSADKDR